MGKLTFKGDAPKKKKHKSKSKSSGGGGASYDEEAPEGWIPIPLPTLALGPLYLTLPKTAVTDPLCVALQPTTGKVFPFPLPTSSSLASSSALALDAEELEAVVEGEVGSEGPQDVHHVWVCTRIPDSANKVTFRSATGKFLAADEMGQVSADREARGMQEEWTLDDAASGSGTVIRSSYGKCLSADSLVGGKMELRADEENEGDNEKWKVWMQGEYLVKARKALIERSGVKAAAAAPVDGLVITGSLGKAEEEYIQKYQARGQGRLVSSKEDVRDLKRARAEGKLGEAMLERRVKLKSDRYC